MYQKEIDKISQLPRLGKELNSVYYSLVSLPSILNKILEWVIIKKAVYNHWDKGWLLESKWAF